MNRPTQRDLIWRCTSLSFLLCSLLFLATKELRAEDPIGQRNSQSHQHSPLYGTYGAPASEENQETINWYFSHLSAVHDRRSQGQKRGLDLYYEICNLYPRNQGRKLIASWPDPVGLGTAQLGLSQSKCLALARDAHWEPNDRIPTKSVPLIFSQASLYKSATVYASNGATDSSSGHIITKALEGDTIDLSLSYYVHYASTQVENHIRWSSSSFWVGFMLSNDLAEFIASNQLSSSVGGASVEFISLHSAISDNDVEVMRGVLGDRLPSNGVVMTLGRNSNHTASTFTISDEDNELNPGRVVVMLVTREDRVIAWALLDGVKMD